MTEIKPCPFRVHGEKKASLTVAGEYYYNEYFMPCLRKECPCYLDVGYEIRCVRGYNTYLVLAERGEEEWVISETWQP